MSFGTENVDKAIDFVIESLVANGVEIVHYTPMFEAADLPTPQELYHGGDSDALTAVMQAFRDRCVHRGLPPLDSVVVHATSVRSGYPGRGYFRMHGYVDPIEPRPSASVDKTQAAVGFWKAEQAKVGKWAIDQRSDAHSQYHQS